MARQQFANSGDPAARDEHVTVLNPNANPDEVELKPVDDLATATVVADATQNSKIPVGPVPEKRIYTVIKGGSVLMGNGIRTVIKEGKIIDNLNYDTMRLQTQGIRLERLQEDQIPSTFVE